MAESKIEIKVGNVEFSGSGSQKWVSEQLEKMLTRIPELVELGGAEGTKVTKVQAAPKKRGRKPGRKPAAKTTTAKAVSTTAKATPAKRGPKPKAKATTAAKSTTTAKTATKPAAKRGRKPAAKKATPAKAAAKRATTKVAAKKTTAAKAAAPKAAAKKTTTRKTTARKTTARKTVAKKAAPKKVVAKKAAPKKTVAKKATPKAAAPAAAKGPAVSSARLTTFLKKHKAVENQTKRFLGAAAYMQKNGYPTLTTRQVSAALKAAKMEKLSNASQMLNNNVNRGYCAKDGKVFTVTAKGLSEFK